MKPIEILSREFSTQAFSDGEPYDEMLDRYKSIACSYAHMENAVAVLSDLRTNASYICYGNFARTLGISQDESVTGSGPEMVSVSSIWEEDIFRLIHPDDLAGKHLHELCFFHFIKRQPRKNRADWYLISKLRMKGSMNSYIPVLHRMFYIQSRPDGALWLALCLYGPLAFDIPSQCMVINSVDGSIIGLESGNSPNILTPREKQILTLIDKGLMSKEISGRLSISINTVSRHRQEILGKLQVKNSIEACRIAKDLKLI